MSFAPPFPGFRPRPSAFALLSLILGSLAFWTSAACSVLGGRDTAPRHTKVDLFEPVEFAFEGRSEVVETLPVLRPKHPFHELLLSWNVETSSDIGLAFEARVGRGPDGWSPWLYFGEWNTVRPQDAEVEFENGRIDVDHFTSDVYWERVQVRVTARFSEHPAGDAWGAVQRLHLCFTDRRVLSSFQTPVPRTRAALPVPVLSQREQDPEIAARICSPTSLAMVLGLAGIEATPRDVALRAYDASFDIFGNWPRSIQAAHSFGIPGYVTRFASWRPIDKQLALGNPVILSIAFGKGELDGAPLEESSGHLVIVVGFDDQGDVIVNDPAGESAGRVRRVYRRDQLTRAWLGHGGTVYVLEVSTADQS